MSWLDANDYYAMAVVARDRVDDLVAARDAEVSRASRDDSRAKEEDGGTCPVTRRLCAAEGDLAA